MAFVEAVHTIKGNRRFILQSMFDLESERKEKDPCKLKSILERLIAADPIRTNYYEHLLLCNEI